MKKRVFFAALALFSFAAFFSCSNAAGGSDSESSKPSSASASKKPGYVTLTGTVSVSGAVPKILSDNYDSSSDNDGVSRSAQPGINTSGDGATMEYFARATSGDLVSEGAFGTGAEAKMFGLELQAGIEWTIVVGVREKSTSKLIPERTVYLSSTWKVKPDPASPTISHNFVPVPNTSGGTGSIALKINYSPSLYEVKLKFVDGPSGFEALNDDDENWSSIAADGGRIYKMSNIPSGKYELCLDFKDTNSQVLVYSTIQSVTVANGMTTDSWVADSSSSAVSPISASGEFNFNSNASTLMAAFLGTNLFVGKVSDDCAAPDDTNSGNYLSPLKTVTGAVKKIAQAGSGGADYVIRVRGEVSGVGTNSAATITSSLISTSNAKSLTIIGTSGDGTDCIKSANSQAPAVNISTNVPITFKKIKIMGSKSGAGPGEAINAFGGSKVTIDEGSLITGGKIGVNVTGDSTKVTMKGGSFSGNDADVYLESGKVLTVDCNLSDVADKGIVVSLQSWTRGTQFLEAGASLGTLSDAIVGKFDFTKTGWDTPIYDSEKKAKIDADIYVAASGKDSETVDGIAVENTIGNKAYPFKTIAKAAALLDASHNKICIDGSVGKQTISATDLPTSKCSSLILCGANGLDDDDIPKDKIDAGGTSDCGTALTIGTAVPITIQNLKITGGNKGNSSPNYNKGGGIYLQSGSSLELADGAMVTGNTCGLYGGGIYTESNTTLFMYGTSYVGDKTATTASGNDPAKCSNSASYGGGIHNCGKVYLGYKKDGSSFKEADWTGGVCRNYVENNGGGIYNSTSGEIKMRAGTISYNKGSRYAGGIAVSASGNAVELLGGTLKENEATRGGAVYVENSFSMQGSAYIPSGVKNNSGVLVSGTGKNDVYLVDGKTVTVAGTLSPKSNGLSSGTTKTNSIEALALSSWSRGTKFLSATSTYASSLVAAKSKIALSKDPNGWTKSDDATTSSADTRYAWITSPIYVASSGTDSTRKVCSAAPTSGNNGTKTSPYATISAALAASDLPKADNTITIDGTLSAQTIPSGVTLPTGVTAVTLQGYKAEDDTSSAATIKGGGTTHALAINKSATYTIKDLQITNGSYDYGGGIYLIDGTVNLDSGAKVYGNNAKDQGAGVYVASGATLNIKSGSEIYSNSLSGGSVMQGGGVYNNGNVAIDSGSKIYKNSVSAGSGGAIYNAGTLTMSGGTIGGSDTDKNTAKYGGGIYNDEEKSLTISGGEISYNSATSDGQSNVVWGGAIANNGTLTISGAATISNNTAIQTNSSKGTAYGGGIYNQGYVEITGAITMDGNSASVSATTSGSSLSRGGAIYNNSAGTLTMTKGTIGTTSANTVTGTSVSVMQGGAIYQGGTFNVSGSAKVYNASQTATKNDVYLADGKVVTINNTYNGSGNTSSYKMALTPANWKRGSYVLGGVSCSTTNAGYFMITDTEYSVLTDSTHKGKIDTGSTIYVSEAKISTATGYNTGSDTTGRGTQKYPFATIQAAALETWKAQAYTISVNGTLTATGTGTDVGIGNLQNIPNNTKVTATSITLSGTNSAKIDAKSKGSALKINKAVPVTIKNITITGGSATNGGGIYVSAASASLTLGQGAKVSANTVTGNGGGIYIAGTSGTGKTANLIMNSSATVSGNSATGTSSYGGGVYLYYANLCMSGNALIGDTSGTSAATSGSTGHSNMAKNGGGIYCDTGSKVYLGYSSTSDSGTDLSASYGIRHNYASSCGGGIFVNAGTVNFKTGAISCNGTTFSTDCDGGGIWQNSGTTVTISGGTIAKNSAYYGGGVYAGGTFSMSGGTIGDSSTSINAPAKDTSGYYSNYAAYGGGIYAPTGASVSLTGGYVSYNYATFNGGGIMAIPAFSFSATANYNGASSSGGGIKCANVTISGGTIKGNKASYYGGGIHSTGIITMSGGTITENVVGGSGDGGAVYLTGSSAVINFEGSAKIVAGSTATNNTVYLTNSAKVGVNGSNLPTSSTIATIVPYPYSDTNQVMGIDSAAVCAPQFNVWNNSYTWNISPTTGKLQYTNVLSNTSMANYSVSSGTKYNFVIPADVEQENLEKFLDKLFNHNDTPTIGAGSSIDFSKVTSSIRLDSTIVGGGSDRRTNNITTFIVPGGSGDIYFHDSTYKPLMSVKEYIAPADSENYTSVDGVLYNKDMTELIKYPAAKTNTAFTIPDSVETVSSGAFYGAIYLQQITIPGSVKRLGECSFYNSGLVSVTIPGNEDILNAGYIFSNCEILSSVTINYGVKYIGTPYQAEVFKGCKNLKTVSIPNSVTRIGRAAFEDCFKNYSGSITVPSGVNHLGNGVFYGCTKLSLTFNCTPSGWKDYNGNTFSSANFTTNYFVNTGNLELTRN